MRKYEVAMTIYVGSLLKENYQTGCHLKNIGHSKIIFDMLMLLGIGTYLCQI